MAFHSSSIELSSETKKGFGRWLIFALLVVAAAFFLGSWVESRLDDSIRRHDALVAAAVEQAAPEALPSVIASLQSDDDNAAAQGEALLSTLGYTPQEQHTGARGLFTAFMLFVMLLRGAKLVYGTRRMVKNVRGVSRTASTQLLSLVSNEPTAENIPIRQAVQELSELVEQPLQSARTLTEIVLQKNLDEEKYKQFCRKLKTQLDKTQDFLLLLTKLSSLQEDMEQNADFQTYPLTSLVQATQTLVSPSLEARGMHCEFSTPPAAAIRTDHQFFPQALSHLVLSCTAQRQPGSTVHVAMALHDSHLSLEVSCHGRRTKTRSRLVRIATKKLRPSSLDLAVADTIFRFLGASLEEQPDLHGGKAYRIRLPLSACR